MSEFSKKILNGQVPSATEWMDHLIEAHKENPSMTSNSIAPHKTKAGKNSYETLAESLKQENLAILDLACGDGYLIQYLLPKLGPTGKIHGVDMSAGELEVAKSNYQDPRVQFHEAKAQALPLPDHSIDLILSHMAFMLMEPIESVVKEIARVLKPGGQFTAIIDGARSAEGAWLEIRKILGGFIRSRYPAMFQSKTGDSRLASDEGLAQVFGNGFTIENIQALELQVEISPEAIWEWVKDFYFVAIIPDHEKILLKTELIQVARKNCDSDGRLRFEDSMRMFTAVKH